MRLEDLCVLHLAKNRVKCLPSFEESVEGVFHLETCQRLLWISNSEHFENCPTRVVGSVIYRGREAYLFLLRLAAGLESEVLGETDVFGQFKEAWKKTDLSGKSKVLDVKFWIQKLFEDTKEIRSRYLQNLGGSSYGTLVRKLIREQQGSPKGPLLLIGAGQIAQSIGPILSDEFELLLSNRNLDRLSHLYDQLIQRPGAQVRKCETLEEEIDAWREAAHVVLCIPFNPELDEKRIQWSQQGKSENRFVIHLGGMRKHCGNWGTVPHFYCLNDLFKLQSSIGTTRSIQISHAVRACEERSKLRYLGASLSISHGWEDLACFA